MNTKGKGFREKDPVLRAIQELAEATGTQFDRMTTRFDRVDARLDHVEGEVRNLRTYSEKRFNDLQEQITRIESYILRDHQHWLEVLERKIGVE